MTTTNRTVSVLAALSAQRLWIAYHDFSGIGRAKAVPLERFDDACSSGVSFAKANWDFIVTDHQVPEPKYGADSGDFRVVPDPAATWPLPHRAGVVQSLGWLVADGAPWGGDPRAALARATSKLEARGLTAQVALEAEFVLLHRSDDGQYGPADRGRMFTTDDLEARWPLIDQWLNALGEMQIPVHQVAKEYGPAQYEISLLPAHPLAAVDRFLMTRQVIRAISRDAGYIATFMPKPFDDLPGNGLHVHISLQDGAHRDAMEGVSDTDLSEIGRSAVAGILSHAVALAAVGSPTPNSYKRLLPGSWAPAHVCWAFGNRAALVRIPGPGRARHIEYRAGDASANPYLLLAGLITAITDGLERSAEPPPEVRGDVGHWNDEQSRAAGVTRFPGRLSEAMDGLAGDEIVSAALGATIAERYQASKRFELASYLDSTGADEADPAVSEWERTTYADVI